MIELSRVYPKGKDILNAATRFSIGNGHIGYRGTLEEESEKGLPCFSRVGFYDQFQDKWREPVAYRIPFSLSLKKDNQKISFSKTTQTLDLEDGVYYRNSISKEGVLRTERFASRVREKLIAEKIVFNALEEGEYSFSLGRDVKIHDINGPHFKEKEVRREENLIHFHGVTNEEYDADEFLMIDPERKKENQVRNSLSIFLKKGECITFHLLCYVFSSFFNEKANIDEVKEVFSLSYEELKKEHEKEFSSRFSLGRIEIEGDKKRQLALDYCNYLLVSHKSEYVTSISARGFSGQTYKGAAFWDSEIFLLPYYLLFDKDEARNLILYRIKGLKGAKEKAKRFDTDGAFYAWESQEDGKEACTRYSVTDPKTGKGIRTYFIDKQIHISSDVAIALDEYLSRYPEKDILLQGGLEELYQIAFFYYSYSQKKEDGFYHLDDVIGPDEYHERVDDNAFTNYQAKKAVDIFFHYLSVLKEEEIQNLPFYPERKKNRENLKDFADRLYLPKPNKDGIIEQFKGYLSLEDCTIEDVRKRLKDKNQYWGGKEGPASKTRVIKQADVVALMALNTGAFSKELEKKNYEFYLPYTEHGSSLSSSRHSLLAFRLGKNEEGYRFRKKSSLTDISGKNKEYAGGIYIGGLHRAAAGGAYLSLIYGRLGYDGKDYHPHFKKEIKKVVLHELTDEEIYQVIITKDKVIKKRRSH